MKLQVGLDHDGMLPGFAVATESKVSDLAGARWFAFCKGSIKVFDKGYSDYRGVFLVTRARSNIDVTVVDEHPCDAVAMLPSIALLKPA